MRQKNRLEYDDWRKIEKLIYKIEWLLNKNEKNGKTILAFPEIMQRERQKVAQIKRAKINKKARQIPGIKNTKELLAYVKKYKDEILSATQLGIGSIAG